MKLPLSWLEEYLEGGLREESLQAACARWGLAPNKDPARTLATLMTFAGFEYEDLEGAGREAVLELAVLANRPDCQGIVGLAREVAAVLRVPLKSPPCDVAESAESAAALASVTVEEPELCPRYTARVIRGVKVGPSPEWLQRRLALMGLVPRNNVVDVTNYVLFELNQPLHAFDLKKLAGRKIIVRRAKASEAFQPLYGELPPLTPETLVIADAERPVAIGGIIGGSGSEVDESTTDLLLESACFHPAHTRRSCRRLKVGTDASFRFERGVDIEAIARASARAARLIVEAAGGAVAKGLLDSRPAPRPPKSVRLRHEKLCARYGVDVPLPEAQRHLEALGCAVEEADARGIRVTVPSWRRGDLEREVDLIEEVARLHGYVHIPARTAMRARIPPRSTMKTSLDAVRDLFVSLGYFETVSDTLVDPHWPQPALWSANSALKLDPESVLREDHSVLRSTLLVSLLAVAKHNQDRRAGTARLFECGKVFLPRAGGAPPEERPALGLLDDLGFRRLADALGRLGEALSFAEGELVLRPPAAGRAPDCFTPDTACRVIRVRHLGGGERAEDAIGWLGVVASALCRAFDLKGAPAAAEINLAALASMPTAPRRCRPLPTQPEVARDVALVVDEAVSWHEIERFAARYKDTEALRDTHEPPRFLSVYRGKQIGAGRKSVAFSVCYRAAERSLTDEEVNAAHERFIEALLKKFQAQLRK